MALLLQCEQQPASRQLRIRSLLEFNLSCLSGHMSLTANSLCFDLHGRCVGLLTLTTSHCWSTELVGSWPGALHGPIPATSGMQGGAGTSAGQMRARLPSRRCSRRSGRGVSWHLGRKLRPRLKLRPTLPRQAPVAASLMGTRLLSRVRPDWQAWRAGFLMYSPSHSINDEVAVVWEE